MSVRVFPSATLWAVLALIAIADVVLMVATDFRPTGTAWLAILAVSAAAAGLGYLYSTVRRDDRLSALAFAAAYLIAYTLAGATLSYIGTSLGLPLLDANLARIDTALGFDWLATLEFVDRRPLLGAALRFSYASSMAQVVFALIVLAATRQFVRLGDFLALFTITSLTTVLLSSLLPAAGAFVHYDPPATLRDVVGADAGIWHLKHFTALRSGAMHTIDAAAIEGLVTFPSFHTALAVVTAWAFWRTRFLASAAIGLNALVIASTVPVGGHYLIDVLAGGALAAAAIVAVGRRRRARADAWVPAGVTPAA
ncbi:MAG TPA: phosphatase PAP2 family protein [Hyphomicrobiaceae bacterium]|nr:phosphatase PAP2 family protein [Hyphomicrobiaceae bacterium]